MSTPTSNPLGPMGPRHLLPLFKWGSQRQERREGPLTAREKDQNRGNYAQMTPPHNTRWTRAPTDPDPSTRFARLSSLCLLTTTASVSQSAKWGHSINTPLPAEAGEFQPARRPQSLSVLWAKGLSLQEPRVARDRPGAGWPRSGRSADIAPRAAVSSPLFNYSTSSRTLI